MVVNTVNGLEIGGRKLRVEYKKVLTEADINKKKERESSQPNSPLLSERKLPASPTTATATTATTTASGTVVASDEGKSLSPFCFITHISVFRCP